MADNAHGQWEVNQVLGHYKLLFPFTGDMGGAWLVYAARHINTGAPALLVRPKKDSVWAPQKSWRGLVHASTEPPYLVLDVDRLPDLHTLPGLTDDLDVLTTVGDCLQFSRSAAEHLRSKPRKRRVPGSQESAPAGEADDAALGSAPVSREHEELETLTLAVLRDLETHREAVGRAHRRLRNRTARTSKEIKAAAAVSGVEVSAPAPAATNPAVHSNKHSEEAPAEATLAQASATPTTAATELREGGAPSQESQGAGPAVEHTTATPGPVRGLRLRARRPYWAALAAASLATLVLVPRTDRVRNTPPDCGTGRATPTGLAEQGLSAAPALLPASTLDPRPTVSLALPPRAFPGQRLAPCKRRSEREIELSDGSRACWIEIKATAEVCKEDGYEWKGGCYLPSIPSQRPPSTSTQRPVPSPAALE